MASILTHALLPSSHSAEFLKIISSGLQQANGRRVLGQISARFKGEGKILCTFRMKASRTPGWEALSSKGVSLICSSIFSK